MSKQRESPKPDPAPTPLGPDPVTVLVPSVVSSPLSVVASRADEARVGAAAPTTDHGPRTTDKVEIGTCLGRMVECPVCKAPTYVTHARGARTPTQVISSKFWVIADCKGFCGKVQRRKEELVTVLPEAVPEPVFKTLGAAVGHFVLCPRDGCGAKAQAAWDMDSGHKVICPDCGTRELPGDSMVEMVG
jgi:hypothetical protein